MGWLLAGFLVVLIFFIAVSAYNEVKKSSYIGPDEGSRNTLSAEGTGRIYAKPDLALINFSVITEGKTVGDAISENSKKMNAVSAALKESGVEEKDIKTAGFNLYPRYEYRSSGVYSSGQRILAGYEARQSLEVKIRELDQIGAIIGQATEKGANQVGELSFTIDDQDLLKSQARKEAVKEAKGKAEAIAGSLGVDLVKVVSYNENSVIPSYYRSSMEGLGIGGAGASEPQIETGQNKIEVSVNIVYEIGQ